MYFQRSLHKSSTVKFCLLLDLAYKNVFTFRACRNSIWIKTYEFLKYAIFALNFRILLLILLPDGHNFVTNGRISFKFGIHILNRIPLDTCLLFFWIFIFFLNYLKIKHFIMRPFRARVSGFFSNFVTNGRISFKFGIHILNIIP